MLNVTDIVQSGGLLLIALILFAEVGLFLGFFLPGDTLLIAAGIYAHQGKMSVLAIIVIAAISAIAGDNTAYHIGKRFGRRMFKDKDSIMFNVDHLEKAEKFYGKYGAKAVGFAHFLPVVRTFTPLVAGIAQMPYKKFFIFDAIGDTLWAVIVTLIGFYVGSKIPNIDHYIMLVIALVIVASVGPTLYQVVTKKILKKK